MQKLRKKRSVGPGRAKPQDDLVGLPWAVENAPSPVMREFARIALQKGLSFGEIARRLNDRDGTRLAARNVGAHFETETPRAPTVQAYAEILSVTDAHLAALRKQSLGGELAQGLRRGLRPLLLRSYEFEKGTIQRVESADTRRLSSAVRALVLAEERGRHNLVDHSAVKHSAFARRYGQPFAAFADALLPEIDLFEAALSDIDPRLVRIWIDLGSLFVEETEDLEHVISFIVRLLRSRGNDTRAMEDALDKARRSFSKGLEIPVIDLAAAIEPFRFESEQKP